MRSTAPATLLSLALTLGCGYSPTAPPPTGGNPTPPATDCGSRTSYRTGDPALDALQEQFRPVLEANRRSFAGQTGSVQGFGAGAVYPQVWLRDSATLIPATRYFYPSAFLESWLEEHLSHQMPSGALWDWIAAGEPGPFLANAPDARRVYAAGGVVLSADKNTTAADQESSAVDAAWRVFQLTGDRAWLAKPIDGRPLLDRLDAALAHVASERFDGELGLVASAFTADWGDVSPAHTDQRAIYLDETTPLVVGLYANAFFARAAEELAALQEAAGNAERTEYWRQVAGTVRARLDLHLWNESGGFYRLHRVVAARGAAGQFDDSDIFALGGNALAALYGPADDLRSARIFAVAEARRRDLGLSSAAAVLMPAYPTGFFLHPILREAYTYQNGGQWDWWSGRFILALFQRGHSRAAVDALRAVASRVAESGGLYEWYARDGRGRGSGQYAGNVGALSGAIYEGLFGLASSAGGLDVTIRLGAAAGGVTVCEPASGRELSYEYDYAPDARKGDTALREQRAGTRPPRRADSRVRGPGGGAPGRTTRVGVRREGRAGPVRLPDHGLGLPPPRIAAPLRVARVPRGATPSPRGQGAAPPARATRGLRHPRRPTATHLATLRRIGGECSPRVWRRPPGATISSLEAAAAGQRRCRRGWLLARARGPSQHRRRRPPSTWRVRGRRWEPLPARFRRGTHARTRGFRSHPRAREGELAAAEADPRRCRRPTRVRAGPARSRPRTRRPCVAGGARGSCGYGRTSGRTPRRTERSPDHQPAALPPTATRSPSIRWSTSPDSETNLPRLPQSSPARATAARVSAAHQWASDSEARFRRSRTGARSNGVGGTRYDCSSHIASAVTMPGSPRKRGAEAASTPRERLGCHRPKSRAESPEGARPNMSTPIARSEAASTVDCSRMESGELKAGRSTTFTSS